MHRKSIGFVASGPGLRKFIRLVKNPTYATPTYASLTVEPFQSPRVNAALVSFGTIVATTCKSK